MKIIDMIAGFIRGVNVDSTEIKEPRANEIDHESKKDPNEKRFMLKLFKIKW